jgi:DNA mismatch repair protein MutS
MEQFIEIKANNPGSLLFYRMGDFYELFFEDALEASRALGITLTKRGQHMGQDIPMCGVPVHAADDYLQKLISLGFRVAVCEQIEDPAEAKKRGAKSVVKRDVVRLVTPGTITEEKLLSPSESNYLMALTRIRASGEALLALAWIDISTGVFRLAETEASRLLAHILRIDPRELILPDTIFHDPELKPVFDVLGRTAVPQPSVLFDSASAEGRIARYFGVATLDGFGTFSRAELAAAAAAQPKESLADGRLWPSSTVRLCRTAGEDYLGRLDILYSVWPQLLRCSTVRRRGTLRRGPAGRSTAAPLWRRSERP